MGKKNLNNLLKDKGEWCQRGRLTSAGCGNGDVWH
jgi:hypothetical protein